MDVAEPDVRTGTAREWVPAFRRAAAYLGAGLWAGFLSGAVIGGVGGRLAMFLLRLTSDPSLRGAPTDDGFTIGSFTGDTMFLLAICAIGGLLAGLAYLAVRGWFPEKYRAAVMGALGAAVGGALIIRPDGIDFTLLEPLALAVVMFIAIPALFGVVTSLLAERFLRSAEERARRGVLLVVVALLPVAAAGPLGIIFIILLLALCMAGWALNKYIPSAAAWRSPAVTWLGRVALAALFLYATVGLVKDTLEIF
ncbi:MAG TPA: hypothetical protein VG929_05840 [Actinomycetota bacterium]|nr:hypothetical protein [Actinomycetota bacterium]